MCVVSNNSSLAKKSMLALQELKREEMILRLPGSGTQNLFAAHLESINMSVEEFKVILEAATSPPSRLWASPSLPAAPVWTS